MTSAPSTADSLAGVVTDPESEEDAVMYQVCYLCCYCLVLLTLDF
jgi:hypothetical protein